MSALSGKNSRRARLVANAHGGNGFHHAVADAVCTGRTAVAYLAVRYSYRRQRHARHLANDQTGRYDNGGDGLFLRYWCPLILVSSIAYLWFGNRLGMNLRPVLLMLERLKEWVMLDIYTVGIGVASIKVQDYAHIRAGVGLFSLWRW